METIDDIIAEMRSGKLSATVECENCGSEYEQRFSFDTLADRIEAAVEYTLAVEKAKAAGEGYAAGEQAVTNCNQLKMREVVAETEKRIKKVISILTEIPDSCGYGRLLEDAADELCDLKEEFIKPTLSAPPRNCDRFDNEEDAFNEWSTTIGKNYKFGQGGYGMAWAFTKWLFAKAKGESK